VLSIRPLELLDAAAALPGQRVKLFQAVGILGSAEPQLDQSITARTLAWRGADLPRNGGIDHNARLAVDLARAPTSFVRP
jgi:hypothetical protein